MATKIQINDEESLEVSSILTGTAEGFSAPRQHTVVGKYEVTE